MEKRIAEIEDKLTEIIYRLDFNDQTNETQLKCVNELNNSILSSKNLDEKFIEKFELIDLKLKNVKTEFELLHTEIRTLKILIETINIKIGNK
ncbi:hypothetical protein BXY82_0001 [Gelidibacter sediminis]|uniref:Uncharacterized protein n=1 Tax=Gelidibacter sediminis TaxID=1608710 RepID=A0A4R7QCI3_9FLAO|nr:hypothetical protein [Gelidibacter sediminis]TDU44550.1 hypothetical protein BXY82_0001 [Gelidibacter sediminis]